MLLDRYSQIVAAQRNRRMDPLISCPAVGKQLCSLTIGRQLDDTPFATVRRGIFFAYSRRGITTNHYGG